MPSRVSHTLLEKTESPVEWIHGDLNSKCQNYHQKSYSEKQAVCEGEKKDEEENKKPREFWVLDSMLLSDTRGLFSQTVTESLLPRKRRTVNSTPQPERAGRGTDWDSPSSKCMPLRKTHRVHTLRLQAYTLFFPLCWVLWREIITGTPMTVANKGLGWGGNLNLHSHFYFTKERCFFFLFKKFLVFWEYLLRSDLNK